MEISMKNLRSLIQPIDINSINVLKNNNIISSEILIIISAILFSIIVYYQLIKLSTVLVIPTNKNKKNDCKFI